MEQYTLNDVPSEMIQPEFTEKLHQAANAVNRYLDTLLTEKVQLGELSRPERLVAAMRHGVLQGGKRLRPFLALHSAALFGVKPDDALPLACALECLHSYSLIHDDLPAMDDDDLRRGQPTVHKAFDEATAILAGDALLTLSFDIITDPACHPDGAIRAQLANMLARASGQGGMIGGQMLDLEAEKHQPTEGEVRILQAMKTGALLRYACEAGAVLGGADKDQQQALRQYGETIGLAFQLADDLLDVTSTSQIMGKAVGKDAARGKGTLVGLYGIEKTQSMLIDLVNQAENLLSPFGASADTLVQTAHYISARKN